MTQPETELPVNPTASWAALQPKIAEIANILKLKATDGSADFWREEGGNICDRIKNVWEIIKENAFLAGVAAHDFSVPSSFAASSIEAIQDELVSLQEYEESIVLALRVYVAMAECLEYVLTEKVEFTAAAGEEVINDLTTVVHWQKKIKSSYEIDLTINGRSVDDLSVENKINALNSQKFTLNRSQLMRLLNGAINNAFSPERGGATKIVVNVHWQEDKAIIEIKDDGKGFSEEMLEIDQGTNQPAAFVLGNSGAGSSGLGLADADKVVSSGSVTISNDGLENSQGGLGACLTITLPATDFPYSIVAAVDGVMN